MVTLVEGDILDASEWLQDWRDVVRARDPKPMDVIRVNGKLHAVESVEWKKLGAAIATTTTAPLADGLTRNVIVGENVSLGDALIEAGWTPPAPCARGVESEEHGKRPVVRIRCGAPLADEDAVATCGHLVQKGHPVITRANTVFCSADCAEAAR